MTMEEILGKLRGLQEILSQKIVLEQEISEIPKILTTQEELLSRLKKSFIALWETNTVEPLITDTLINGHFQ